MTLRQSLFFYLVGYDGGDPVFSSVGVDEDVVVSSQWFGPCPGCDGLLEGLVQKLGPRVHTERLDRWLSDFAVYIYLEWTSLMEGDKQEVIQLVSTVEVCIESLDVFSCVLKGIYISSVSF